MIEDPDKTLTREQERSWAIGLHLSLLLGLLAPVLGFLAPLAIWLIKRPESPYLDAQGREVMNLIITVLIFAAVSAVLCLVLVGFVLLVGLGLACLVLPIMAAVSVSNGKDFRYPCIIRFLK